MQTRDNGTTLAYMARTFVQEPAWLAPVRAAGEARRPGMQLSPYEGHLLRWLVQLSGARTILEIGTFMGYSALWMASAGARVTTLEFNRDAALLAQAHIAASPHADAVTVVHGDALAWLAQQPQERGYDLLFIDAEKRNYVRYLEAALPLLRPGGLIVGDNTLLWGAVTGEAPDAASKEAIAAMQQFNALLADAAQFESVMLPTPEGLTVARLKA